MEAHGKEKEKEKESSRLKVKSAHMVTIIKINVANLRWMKGFRCLSLSLSVCIPEKHDVRSLFEALTSDKNRQLLLLKHR